MKSYSEDLRERVIAAALETQNISAVARTFKVGRPTIHDWLRLYSQTGSLAPLPRPGRPRLIPPELEPKLDAQIQNDPDATLKEHVAKWAAETGVQISISGLHRILSRMDWTVKKKRFVRANETKQSEANLPRNKNI